MKNLHPSLIDGWEIWRLVVIEKVCTLQEINTYWTYSDVKRANAVLDFSHAVTEAESDIK